MLKCIPKKQQFLKYGVSGGVSQKPLEKHEPCGNQWVCEIERGFSNIHGENLDYDGFIVPDCSFIAIDNPVVVSETEAMRVGWDKRGFEFSHIRGDIVSLTTNIAYQNNYFHWLFDVLPRLGLASMVLRDKQFKVYCQTSRLFQRDSLRILGIETSDIVPAQEYKTIRADNLYVPSVADAFNNLPAWNIKYLQQKLVSKLKHADKQGGRKLLISRRDAKHRKALNEHLLEERLVIEGFEVVLPGELSLYQQSDLFSKASVVVAFHGASLSNLIFCRPGTRVLEISPPKFEWDVYEKLAQYCQLNYRRVTAYPSKEEKINRYDYQKTDFKVSLEHISDALAWVAK